MASKTELCNLAISNLGSGQEIQNFDTDTSEEAAACRRHYEDAKKSALADHDWTFATKFQVLNLVETFTEGEWKYSYRYPVDALKVRRIKSGARLDTADSGVPYKIIQDASGLLIYTDEADAEIEYTIDVTDPSFFSSQFSIAFSFRLAYFIVARISGGDPFKLKNEMLTQYLLELGTAKANDLNSERQDPKPESEFITARY